MKYIYLGGTISIDGMVLKKRSIIEEKTFLEIKKRKPELITNLFTLDEFARNKAKIKKEGLNKVIIVQKGEFQWETKKITVSQQLQFQIF